MYFLFQEVNNPADQDEKAEIPKEVLNRFAELGAFGCVVPPEYEGAGLNNTQMARLAEIIGQNDLSLGVVMGAHQVSFLSNFTNNLTFINFSVNLTIYVESRCLLI